MSATIPAGEAVAAALARMYLLLPKDRDRSPQDEFFQFVARRRGVLEILGCQAADQAATLQVILERVRLTGDALRAHLEALEASDAFAGELARLARHTAGDERDATEQHAASVTVLIAAIKRAIANNTELRTVEDKNHG